jgi:hypothetical protein
VRDVRQSVQPPTPTRSISTTSASAAAGSSRRAGVLAPRSLPSAMLPTLHRRLVRRDDQPQVRNRGSRD